MTPAFMSKRKTWLPSRVHSQRSPLRSKSSERGPRNGVPRIAAPSGVSPALPVPAKVSMRFVFMSMRRMTLFPMSHT